MQAYKPTSDAPLNYYSIENFKGVDCTNGPLTVKPYRSPDAKNVLIDKTGVLVSRTGYEEKYQVNYEYDIEPFTPVGYTPTADDYKINGFYKVINYDKEDNNETNDYDVLAHIGGLLFNLKDLSNNAFEYIAGNKVGFTNDNFLAKRKSQGIQFNDKFYLFDGKEALAYGKYDDQINAYPLSKSAYIPTTVISRDYNGGGTSYEPVNMATKWKINQFLGKTGHADYQVEDYNIETTGLYSPTVWVLSSSGEWVEKIPDKDYTFDSSGLFSFTASPGESPVTGRDNIKIKYAVIGEDDEGYPIENGYTEYQKRVNNCTIITSFGINGNNDRLFITGNPNFPNVDWYSETNKEIYFPDINYSYIGSAVGKITGYSHLGDGSLAIHKEDNGNEPAIYYRTATTFTLGDGRTTTAFTLQQGALSIGSIAKRAIKQFINDPLILTKQGVFAITPVNNSAYNERYALLRSYFINKKLLLEDNLEQAEGFVYDGYYYLSLNNHVYVADSRQKSYIDRSEDYQYEWYYLDNIPARCFLEYDNKLWFGTDDGRIMYFKSKTDAEPYKDNINGTLTPIEVYWKTPILNLGTYNRYKSLKNLYVVPIEENNSKVNIDYIIKSINNTVYKTALSESNIIFDFSNIDFSDFSFNTDTGPRVVPTNYKAKKFILIQFMLWQNEGKPFGFYALSLTYTVGGKFKG